MAIITKTLKSGKKSHTAIVRVGGRQVWKAFLTMRDAKDWVASTRVQANDGTFRRVRPLLMAELFDRWAAVVAQCVQEGSLRHSTSVSYLSHLKQLRRAFAHYRSDQLSHQAIAAWAAEMASRIEQGTMAAKTRNHVTMQLAQILKWARKPTQGFLNHNPLEDVALLPSDGREARHVTPDELRRLLDSAGSPDSTIIKMAAVTGARRAEIFGARWSDIDWGTGQGGRFSVRRNFVRGRIGRPKTKRSARTVDIPQGLLSELHLYRELFPAVGDDPYIFRTPQGKPLDPDGWTRHRFTQIVGKPVSPGSDCTR